MKLKIKCQFCQGTGAFNHTCNHCGGSGCMRLGWIEYFFWRIAQYLKVLLDKYGEL